MRVVPDNQLPRLTKATLWIYSFYKTTTERENERAIKRLRCQNLDLKVSDWCIFYYTEGKYKQLFAVGIEQKDIPTLKSRNGLIHYITIKIRGR